MGNTYIETTYHGWFIARREDEEATTDESDKEVGKEDDWKAPVAFSPFGFQDTAAGATAGKWIIPGHVIAGDLNKPMTVKYREDEEYTYYNELVVRMPEATAQVNFRTLKLSTASGVYQDVSDKNEMDYGVTILRQVADGNGNPTPSSEWAIFFDVVDGKGAWYLGNWDRKGNGTFFPPANSASRVAFSALETLPCIPQEQWMVWDESDKTEKGKAGPFGECTWETGKVEKKDRQRPEGQYPDVTLRGVYSYKLKNRKQFFKIDDNSQVHRVNHDGSDFEGAAFKASIVRQFEDGGVETGNLKMTIERSSGLATGVQLKGHLLERPRKIVWDAVLPDGTTKELVWTAEKSHKQSKANKEIIEAKKRAAATLSEKNVDGEDVTIPEKTEDHEDGMYNTKRRRVTTCEEEEKTNEEKKSEKERKGEENMTYDDEKLEGGGEMSDEQFEDVLEEMAEEGEDNGSDLDEFEDDHEFEDARQEPYNPRKEAKLARKKAAWRKTIAKQQKKHVRAKPVQEGAKTIPVRKSNLKQNSQHAASRIQHGKSGKNPKASSSSGDAQGF